MTRTAIDLPNMSVAGPYSHAVKGGGLLFVAGKTGNGADGKLVGPGIAEQTRQTFVNLKAVLAAAGLGFDHVLKCNVYLIDMADFAAMNAIYAEQFAQPYPARTTIAVAALPGSARVEIEMVAELA